VSHTLALRRWALALNKTITLSQYAAGYFYPLLQSCKPILIKKEDHE
jgi:hypothetical protein